MWPKLGPVPTYAIFYLGSMLLFFVIAWRIARRHALKRRVWIVAGLCYVLGMTVGAKVLFDLRNDVFSLPALFQLETWTRGRLWGGLLVYFALAVPAVLLLSKRSRAALDLTALAIPIPWMLVRLGYAVRFPPVSEVLADNFHPDRLYEVALMAFILAAFLILRLPRWRGTKLMWFLVIYGLGRIGIDFLRDTPAEYLYAGRVTMTQILSLAGVAVAPLTLLLLPRKSPQTVSKEECDWHWSRRIMFYEFQVEAYERASGHQKAWGAKMIQELALRGDERILDLGCGNGALTAQLAMRVPGGSVLGIDASQGMIERARRYHGGNLEFTLKDINTLDYDDEFDIVFSNAALHWVRDHRNMLDGVYRALRRDGVIRFNFAAAGNCEHLIAVVRGVMATPPFADRFRDFEWPWYMPSLEEYAVLIRQSEFDDIKVWIENADQLFPDAATMIRWIDQPSLVPFLAHLDEPLQRQFRDAVIEQMTRETRQRDGRYFETFRRMNVSARKEPLVRPADRQTTPVRLKSS